MGTAFESITTRQAWHASEPIEKYDAVEINADGLYALAIGDGQFAGIAQYGAEVIGDMATVVKGTFPALLAPLVTIVAGDKVTIDPLTPGSFKVAAAGDVVYGIAFTGATPEGLFTLAMADIVSPAVV